MPSPELQLVAGMFLRVAGRCRGRCAGAIAVPRRAFTLLEVLLVLGLLVIIGSLSWPSLQRPLANQRLSGAAKQVRVALAQTRLAAIESGEPYQFQFLPGGNKYRVGTFELLLPNDDATSTSDDSRPRLTRGGHKPQRLVDTQSAAAFDPLRWDEYRLPETITFAVVEHSESVPEALLVPNSLAAQSDLGESDAESWSAAIVFQPDGSATNRSVTLLNERSMQIEVSVRGLTGAARVGTIEPRDENTLNSGSKVQQP